MATFDIKDDWYYPYYPTKAFDFNNMTIKSPTAKKKPALANINPALKDRFHHYRTYKVRKSSNGYDETFGSQKTRNSHFYVVYKATKKTTDKYHIRNLFLETKKRYDIVAKAIRKAISTINSIESFEECINSPTITNAKQHLDIVSAQGIYEHKDNGYQIIFDILASKLSKKLNVTQEDLRVMRCPHCDTFVRVHNITIVNNIYTCKQCESKMKRCCCCNGRFHIDDFVGKTEEGNENTLHCYSCAKSLSLILVVDDGLLHHKASVFYWKSDGHWHLTKEKIVGIQKYGTTVPSCLSKYDDKVVYCGMELETFDNSGDAHAVNVANLVREQFEDYVGGIEYDRSLTADPTNPSGPHIGGAEYITNYGEPLEHERRIDSLCSLLKKNGLISHNDPRCGLHVHLSKTSSITQFQIAKMVLFWNIPDNKKLIHTVARRYGTAYAKLKPVDKNNWQPLSKKTGEEGHKEIVNINNSHTVEVRAFRGSLNPVTVKASLALSYLSWQFCRDESTTVDNLDTKSFIDWCKRSVVLSPQIQYCWEKLKVYLVGHNFFKIVGGNNEQLNAVINRLHTQQTES